MVGICVNDLGICFLVVGLGMRWLLVVVAFVLVWPESGAFGAVSIAPHRAIYKMGLQSAKNGSNISDVSGQMVFEWADACEGWAVQQKLNLHFSYAEGDESEVDSSSVSWEAKDGGAYNFNSRRTTNGKETENYRGHAMLSPQGGHGLYAIPKAKDVKLPAGALFPSAHTTMILEKAQAGEALFTRRVFDGSDEDGDSDVSVFIGTALAADSDKNFGAELKSRALLASPAWPVRLAFFKPESETGEPDYEMDLVLQANGVARRMQIDYGDFTVSGVLAELEALPKSGC